MARNGTAPRLYYLIGALNPMELTFSVLLPTLAIALVPVVWFLWFKRAKPAGSKPPLDPNKASLRVMSYNVLADGPRYALSR